MFCHSVPFLLQFMVDGQILNCGCLVRMDERKVSDTVPIRNQLMEAMIALETISFFKHATALLKVFFSQTICPLPRVCKKWSDSDTKLEF